MEVRLRAGCLGAALGAVQGKLKPADVLCGGGCLHAGAAGKGAKGQGAAVDVGTRVSLEVAVDAAAALVLLGIWACLECFRVSCLSWCGCGRV